MKRIIERFYKRFDNFLDHSVSGNLRVKVWVTAILTGILICGLVILSVSIAFIEFEITIPAAGTIDRIINETTIEFKVLISAKYQKSIEIGQKTNIWFPSNGKIPHPARITKIGKITKDGNITAYLQNICSLPVSPDKILIGEKIKSRIIVDKKKLYKLLLK